MTAALLLQRDQGNAESLATSVARRLAALGRRSTRRRRCAPQRDRARSAAGGCDRLAVRRQVAESCQNRNILAIRGGTLRYMNRTEHKLMRLEQIARLRRAQRHAPQEREIGSVRAELEVELGETVSQRLAARFLGVSHTALQRWIRAGDLPLVYNPRGRREVPVAALLDLNEGVERERARGRQRRRHLEVVMKERRERARRIRAADLGVGTGGGGDGHGGADRRALAYHRAVAKRLDRQMIGEARHHVCKWRSQGKLDPRYADEWEQVLRLPLADVRRTLVRDDEPGRDLRQNSPFAGMLSEPERQRVLELVD